MTATLGPPDPLRTGRPHNRAAEHRLGSEHPAIRRIAAAADQALGQASSGPVPLRVLGDALTAPTGGRFDDDDPEDRRLLARVLALFSVRLQRFGFELRSTPSAPVAGSAVVVDRRPRAAGMRAAARLATWADVAPRAELARWAADRADPDEPGPDPDDDADDDRASIADLPARLQGTGSAAAWAAARAVCRDPARLPPVTMVGNPSTTTSRPLVVVNGLTQLSGCARDPVRTPCVPVHRGVWACPRCGTRTPVPERLTGPRVPECACWDAVCCHVGPTAALTRPQPRGGA